MSAESVSQQITRLLGTDDWLILHSGHTIVTDEELDLFELDDDVAASEAGDTPWDRRSGRVSDEMVPAATARWKWTCQECGTTGPMPDDIFETPHDCKSRGPFDEVSRLLVEPDEAPEPEVRTAE